MAGCSYLVIGAGGGIGSAFVRQLHQQRGQALLAGRTADKLEALGQELAFPWVALDASLPEAVEAAARQAREQFGQLDGVVNCAGSLLLKPAHLTTDAEWSHTLSSNLTSAFAAVRAAAKVMQSGSVVLVSSAAARLGLANHEAIAAAKAGVIGLTLSAAATYAPRGLRVNCVAPGLVETPLTARITGNETSRKSSESLHALGRVGQPDDVARAIAWLLDTEQSWVTGQVLGVDGGLGTVRSR